MADVLGAREAQRRRADAVKVRSMQEEPNRLIGSLLDPGRELGDDEWRKVIEHVRQAPFRSAMVGVGEELL